MQQQTVYYIVIVAIIHYGSCGSIPASIPGDALKSFRSYLASENHLCHCPEDEGTFPIAGDCTRWCECDQGVGRLRECPACSVSQGCPEGKLYFDPLLQDKCAWPKDVVRKGCGATPADLPVPVKGEMEPPNTKDNFLGLSRSWVETDGLKSTDELKSSDTCTSRGCLTPFHRQKCNDGCGWKSWHDYTWCHTNSGWDYCSMEPGKDNKVRRCAGECAMNGEYYHWCYTDGGYWGYCSTYEAPPDPNDTCDCDKATINNENWVFKKIEYDEDRCEDVGSGPESMGHAEIDCRGKPWGCGKLFSDFHAKKSDTKSSSWTNTFGTSVTAGIETGFNLFSIVEGKVKIDTTISSTHAWGGDVSESHEIGNTFRCYAMDYYYAGCDIALFYSNVKCPFTITWRHKTKDCMCTTHGDQTSKSSTNFNAYMVPEYLP